MDFIICRSKTLGKFYSTFVIVDRITTSAPFVLIQMTYNVEKLSNIYFKKIVQLHGFPISII